jgi:hypothetical protein
MGDNDRTVFFDPNEDVWVNKRNSASHGFKHATRKEAVEQAREHLRNSGGGELTVKNKGTGQFGQKDTVAPGNDPFPPDG